MYNQSPNTRDTGNEGQIREHSLRSDEAIGLAVITHDGKVLAWNPEAGRMLNLSKSGNFSLTDLPLILQSWVREIQVSGKDFTNRRIALPNAEFGSVSTIVSATVSSKPHPTVILLFKDDAPLSKLEQNLSRLDRLASVGLVSASMAHEIKNALVPVRTLVELLLEKHPSEELAGVVRRELSRVDSIVSQMLKFAAPSQPRFDSVKLHEILEYALRLVRHGSDKQLIAFECDFKAVPDHFAGDDRQLEQAFVNLMFNAIEAMEGEGKVSISTDLIPDESRKELRESETRKLLRVRISDTGAGIQPDQLNHIFEPFFTTKETGTGLGLAVTRRIIKEHRGTIHVESDPGKGTTFIILLPACSGAH